MKIFKNNRVYMLIKKNSVTNAMIHNSVYNKMYRSPVLGIKYSLLKVSSNILKATEIFDDYTWYDQEEIKQEINDPKKYLQDAE